MIMKTKFVKNTGTNDQEGANWKITRGKGGKLPWRGGGGQTWKIARGGKGGKKLHVGHSPLCPIAIVRPCG